MIRPSGESPYNGDYVPKLGSQADFVNNRVIFEISRWQNGPHGRPPLRSGKSESTGAPSDRAWRPARQSFPQFAPVNESVCLPQTLVFLSCPKAPCDWLRVSESPEGME